MKSAVIHARIEPETKREAEDILAKLGITPTEAIRVFYRQISLRKGLPFPVAVPNARTATTLRKSRDGQEIEAFDTLDAMFGSWEK
jgi:DNA-damage-inducible protein J